MGLMHNVDHKGNRKVDRNVGNCKFTETYQIRLPDFFVVPKIRFDIFKKSKYHNLEKSFAWFFP